MEETYGLKDYSDGAPVFSVDPVCGMSVDEAKAAAKTNYAGQTFYFCSSHCQHNFEQDPAFYVTGQGARR